MAISYVGIGAAVSSAASGSTVAPGLHGSWQPGDLAVCVVSSGDTTAGTPTMPNGWKMRGTFSGGGGSFGAGTGPRRLTYFTRVLRTGDTAPTVTYNVGTSSSRVFIATIMVLRKTSTEKWIFADAVFGQDTSAGSGFSATTSSGLAIASGDFLVAGYAIADTVTTHSSMGMSASGLTVGTVTQRQNTSNENGNDANLAISTAAPTSGSSTGAVTLTSTLSSSETGAAGVLRIRTEAITDLRAAHTGMWHCAHRGAANMYPEETLEAYAACYADPDIDVLEIDARISADGTIWCAHDANTSRLGTTTVTIATATDAQIAAVNMNNAVLPIGWTGTYKFAKLEDVLELYGDKILISIEPKTQATGDELPNLMDRLIVNKNNVVFPSFDDLYTASLVSAGYKIAVRDTSPATAASMLAKGAVQTNIQLSGAPAAWVAEVQAAGIEVWVWTINTQSPYYTAETRGVKGVISDDPGYVSREKRVTTDPYDTQKAWNGYQFGGATTDDAGGTLTPITGSAGYFNAPDEWGIDNMHTGYSGIESGVLQGWMVPINGNPTAQYYTIDFEANMLEITTGVSNFTIGIAETDTEGFAGGAGGNPTFVGYSCVYRRRGDLQFRVQNVDGTESILDQDTSGGNIPLSTWQSYRLTVTPTSMTITNVTTGQTVTTTDVSQGHGGYIWFGTAGSHSLFRNVSITDNSPPEEPIVASDTASISISDVATVVVTSDIKTASDTATISITETTATTAGRSASDTANIGITESVATQASRSTTDTASISITDVATIEKRFASTDTASVSITDSASVSVTSDTKSASDTGSISITESASIVVSVSASDTATISIADSATTAITTQEKSASDTASLSISESVATFATLTRTDDLTISVADVAATAVTFVAKSASDTATISVSESTSFVKTIPVSDIASVSITDEADVEIAGDSKTANDDLTLTIDDNAVIAATSTGSDTANIGITESTSTLVMITASDVINIAIGDTVGFGDQSPTASDTIGISITDVATIVKYMSSDDSLSIAIEDQASIAASGEFSDSLNIAISEAYALTVMSTGSDQASVSITETSETLVFVTASDTLSISVTESVATATEINVTDTLAVSISESTATTAGIAGQDTASVSITESVEFPTMEIAADDDVTIAITDDGFFGKTIQQSDDVTLTIDDVADIVKTTTFVEIDASDTLTLSVSESTTNRVAVAASDNAAIGITESQQSTVYAQSTDTAAIAVSDTAAAEVQDDRKATSDTAAISITDQASLFVSLSASDTITISIDDQRTTQIAKEASDTATIGIDDDSSVNKNDIIPTAKNVSLASKHNYDILIEGDTNTEVRIRGGRKRWIWFD